MKEVDLGRIVGSFQQKPISNLRCSPIGIVPKKTGRFPLITHLSYPSGNSAYDFIDPSMSSLTYSSFENAVNMIKNLGIGALIGKMDCQAAFRLLPTYYLTGSVLC